MFSSYIQFYITLISNSFFMTIESSVKKQELSHFDKVNFCNQILKSDDKIRSAAFVNINGCIGALIHREGHTPLLSDGESTPALTQATMRLLSRKLHDSKLGRTVYSLTVHEYIARISIPLGDDSALLLSVNRNANYNDIVFKKVRPVLQRHDFDIAK